MSFLMQILAAIALFVRCFNVYEFASSGGLFSDPETSFSFWVYTGILLLLAVWYLASALTVLFTRPKKKETEDLQDPVE